MANLDSNTKDHRHGGKDPLRLSLKGKGVGILIILAIGLASCNVTRTITTTAQTVQRGDTTVTIMTKTVETYDGQLDAAKFLSR